MNTHIFITHPENCIIIYNSEALILTFTKCLSHGEKDNTILVKNFERTQMNRPPISLEEHWVCSSHPGKL